MLKTARILDPRHAAAISSVVAAYHFFKLERFAGLPDKMKAELPAKLGCRGRDPGG